MRGKAIDVTRVQIIKFCSEQKNQWLTRPKKPVSSTPGAKKIIHLRCTGKDNTRPWFSIKNIAWMYLKPFFLLLIDDQLFSQKICRRSRRLYKLPLSHCSMDLPLNTSLLMPNPQFDKNSHTFSMTCSLHNTFQPVGGDADVFLCVHIQVYTRTWSADRRDHVALEWVYCCAQMNTYRILSFSAHSPTKR